VSDVKSGALAPPPKAWSAFARGARDGAGLPAVVLMASLVGIGGLARDVDYPMWAAVLSTVLMWAGPAQVLLFGSLAAGASLGAIAITVSLSSIRFLPMVVSILPLLRGDARGRPIGLRRLLLAAHFVAVTGWTEGRRRMPAMPPGARWPWFMGFGLVIMAAASFATGAGYYLMGALPPVLAAALLFTTPMFFTLSLVAGSRTVADGVALVSGAVLAPLATWLVGRDFDLLVAGLLGGTLAWLLRPRRAAA
jgi:predicted branched-subunit amino acid permease